ncbi:MAG: alpha-galactosidase, partial [Oscillospiraceae bacterium]|nr:alpha-galactosidase [Oscillospiraceae bacterium]
MTELRWKVETDGGTYSGRETDPRGAVRVRPDVPEGTVQKITAVLPCKMAEDERLFMNGFQTWTYCPEYKKNDKIRGVTHIPKFLTDKHGFDRY